MNENEKVFEYCESPVFNLINILKVCGFEVSSLSGIRENKDYFSSSTKRIGVLKNREYKKGLFFNKYQRALFLGYFDDINTKLWEFNANGKESIELLTPLFKKIKKEFNIELKVILHHSDVEEETFLSDYTP